MRRFKKQGVALILFFIITAVNAGESIHIKILGVNDLHGHLESKMQLGKQVVGSGAVLAAYLKQGQVDLANDTVLVFSGDQVGASPATSGLLNEEPTILFLNTLANRHCHHAKQISPKCNLVATLGNHEFDRGLPALLALIYGDNKPPTANWFPSAIYKGAVFPTISANVVDEKTGKLIFPPYVIQDISGVKIGFIGAILKDARFHMMASASTGVRFLDEAAAINAYLPEMKAKGASVIVVLIHQGGSQAPYRGFTNKSQSIKGPITAIIHRLDSGVDVVMAGHTHNFLNAYVPSKTGKKILLTQAYSYGTAYALVDLTVDKTSHQLLNKSASIMTTFADRWPGNKPDAKALKLIGYAEAKLKPKLSEQIGVLKQDILKQPNAFGESAIGDLVADAYRDQMHADIAVIHPGGIRSTLLAGPLTYGDAYAVQPFISKVGIVKITGRDLYDFLKAQHHGKVYQISGFRYLVDKTKPRDSRLKAFLLNGTPIDNDTLYSIAVNEYDAGGGGRHTALSRGVFVPSQFSEADVLANFIKSKPKPFSVVTDGRITN